MNESQIQTVVGGHIDELKNLHGQLAKLEDRFNRKVEGLKKDFEVSALTLALNIGEKLSFLRPTYPRKKKAGEKGWYDLLDEIGIDPKKAERCIRLHEGRQQIADTESGCDGNMGLTEAYRLLGITGSPKSLPTKTYDVESESVTTCEEPEDTVEEEPRASEASETATTNPNMRPLDPNSVTCKLVHKQPLTLKERAGAYVDTFLSVHATEFTSSAEFIKFANLAAEYLMDVLGLLQVGNHLSIQLIERREQSAD